MARVYLYRCSDGHQFEQQGELDDSLAQCECGATARRRPFSSVPYLKGETVVRSIPDSTYRYEAEKREFQSSWGGNDRTVEMFRKNTYEDGSAFKKVDFKGMK